MCANEITGALTDLGYAPGAVARVLRLGKFRGTPGSPVFNPVAAFLVCRAGLARNEWAPGRGWLVHVTPQEARVASVRVPTPDPVAVFLTQFEQGCYKRLRGRPW